jgi:hypothetical protein
MDPQDMERLKPVLEILPNETCMCESCNYTLIIWWNIVGTDYSVTSFGRLLFSKKTIYDMPSRFTHSGFVSFEEIFDSLNQETKEKVLFNLNLFR